MKFFYQRDRCFLLSVSGYPAEIRLEQVFSQEVLDHLCRKLHNIWMIVIVLCIFVCTDKVLIYLNHFHLSILWRLIEKGIKTKSRLYKVTYFITLEFSSYLIFWSIYRFPDKVCLVGLQSEMWIKSKVFRSIERTWKISKRKKINKSNFYNIDFTVYTHAQLKVFVAGSCRRTCWSKFVNK